MKGTYNGDSADSRLNKVRIAKVRFLIGDTNKDGLSVSNEEIEFCLNEEESDNMAAVKVGEALAARLLALNEYEKAEQLKKRCEELRGKVRRSAPSDEN